MFDLSTIVGFAIAYAIILVIMFILNRTENKLDVKIQAIDAAERKRQQEERARKRHAKGGAHPAAGGNDLLLATAAVAAVQQFRADHE